MIDKSNIFIQIKKVFEEKYGYNYINASPDERIKIEEYLKQWELVQNSDPDSCFCHSSQGNILGTEWE